MRTGLEPATLGVTGRYSNRLNYRTNFQYCKFHKSDADGTQTCLASGEMTGRYSNQVNYRHNINVVNFERAVRTGLEPATLGVTGRYSNRLNYRTRVFYSRPDWLKNQVF